MNAALYFLHQGICLITSKAWGEGGCTSDCMDITVREKEKYSVGDRHK